MQHVKLGKVRIAAIHHLDGSGFDEQEIEHLDLMHLDVTDMDECGNSPTQVGLSMQLERGLGVAKRSRVEQSHTKLNGTGIRHIDGCVPLDPQQALNLKLLGTHVQAHVQIVMGTPASLAQRIP